MIWQQYAKCILFNVLHLIQSPNICFFRIDPVNLCLAVLKKTWEVKLQLKIIF